MHVTTFEILVTLETLNYKHIFILYFLTSCLPTSQNPKRPHTNLSNAEVDHSCMRTGVLMRCLKGRSQLAGMKLYRFLHPCPLSDEWLHKSELAVSWKTQSKTKELTGSLRMKNIPWKMDQVACSSDCTRQQGRRDTAKPGQVLHSVWNNPDRNFLQSDEADRKEAFEIYSLQPLYFPILPQPLVRKNLN